MITTGYVRYVLLSFIASAALMAYGKLRGQDTNYILAAVATLFCVVFMSLVVVRLPVFRSYYRNNELKTDSPHFRADNQKAALVMSFLVTGSTFTLGLYAVGVTDLLIPGFCAGIAASIASLYHRPGSRL